MILSSQVLVCVFSFTSEHRRFYWQKIDLLIKFYLSDNAVMSIIGYFLHTFMYRFDDLLNKFFF